MKNATSRGLNHFLPRFREERDSGDTLSMTLENDDDEPPRSRAVAEEEDESIVLFFWFLRVRESRKEKSASIGFAFLGPS